MKEKPISVGVFPDHEQADRALAALEHAGFDKDQIGYVSPSGAFTSVGVPEDDTRYYQHELEKGHTLVTVKGEERTQQALHILQENGALDTEMRHNRPTSRSILQNTKPHHEPHLGDPTQLFYDRGHGIRDPFDKATSDQA
jgi:hypothetical protein